MRLAGLAVGAACVDYLLESGGIWKLQKEPNGWTLSIESSSHPPLESRDGSLESPFMVCQAMNEMVRQRLAGLKPLHSVSGVPEE